MPRCQHLAIHPDNPQPRLLRQAAEQLRDGAIAALPTMAGYLVACRLDDKAAGQRLRWLAGLDDRDLPVLLCRDLAQAASWFRIDDQAYRVIRQRAPGSASFALPCTQRVPRRLSKPSRAQALMYSAGHTAGQALLELVEGPLLAALPSDGAGAGMIDQLPGRWRDGIDTVLDAGSLPALAVFAPRRSRIASAHDDSPVAEATPLAG